MRSRCGKYVITGSQDGVGRVWDVSVFSSSNAPVSASQYQHEGELQIDPTLAGPLPADAEQPIAAAAPISPASVLVRAEEAAPVAEATGQVVAPAPLLPFGEQLPGVVAHVAVPLQAPVTATAAAFTADDVTVAPVAPAELHASNDGVPPIDVQAATAVVPPALNAVPAVPLLPLPPVEHEAQAQAQAPPRPPTQLPQLPQTGAVPVVAIPDVDILSLPAKEPVALLQGHTGPITNIVYSHDGTLIATASIKDGTTRIWQWDKKHKKLHHRVLFAEEETDEDEQLASLYGVQTRKKPAAAVDTLSWTRDDRRLITLHSVKPESHAPDAVWKQRVRVWDPTSGKLVMTLAATDREQKNGHTNAVFVMDVHPTDWRIIVTAGYDGRIFLWDISTGTMLKAFTNVSPDAELVPMLDGGFIPNGNGFCFTDRIGRLLIFGTGSGEQYAATPVQQYFQSDYVALITDRNFNVLDRETQQIPSMMNPGPLVDIYQTEYAHQPPHLAPRGTLLTADQSNENRRLRIQQATESEIKCRVYHAQDDRAECESFPSAVLRSDAGSVRRVERGEMLPQGMLAPSSYRLNGAPVALSELRRRHNANARRRASASLDERDTSILNIEISSEDDHSDEDFQEPARHRNTNDDDDEEDDDEDDEDDDEDDDLDEDDLLSDNGELESPRFRRRRRARAAADATAARFPRRGGRRLQEVPAAGADGAADGDDDDAPRRRTRNSAGVLARRRHVIESDNESQSSGRALGHRGDSGDGATGSSSAGPRPDSLNQDDSVDSHDGVVVETNDGFLMGDNQLDKFDRSVTYDEMLDAKRQQIGTTRDNTVPDDGGEALIPCAFCHGGDDGGVLKLPGDGMGVHPLMNGSQRLFVHDQCAIASPLCFNRGGRWYNVTKEIRRGRSLVCVQCKKRGATVGCTVPSCPKSYHWKCAIECGWSMNQMHFYCPSHESMRSEHERSNDHGGDEFFDPVTRRFGHTFHREWLQQRSLATTQSYVPQAGDYVAYFPQGHQVYRRVFHEREPLFVARFRPYFALKCRVVSVRYVFPTLEEQSTCKSIKCELSLAVLAVPSAAVHASADRTDDEEEEDESKSAAEEAAPPVLEPTSALFDPDRSPFVSFTSVDNQMQPVADGAVLSERFHFQFLYHPHDVANFLVLDHVYENGVRGSWQVGERVEMPLVEMDEHGSETGGGSTQGVIRGFRTQFADRDHARVLTPWECVQVDWDDKDLEDTNVSPWEIEPVVGTPRRLEKQRSEHERRECALFRSRTVRGGKRDVLLQELDTIRNLSISRDFLYPVDSSFLDYVLTVANPIDLTKIQQRVRHGYYRQVEAFIADTQLLYINCETYNVPTSSIAQNSRSIYSALLSQVLRHFPSLLRGENWDPQGECRVFSYPPNDFVEGFAEDDGADPVDQLSTATPATPGTQAAEALPPATPTAPSSTGGAASGNPIARSPVRGGPVTHLHASPGGRTNRSLREEAQGSRSDDAKDKYDEEEDDAPKESTIDARTRSRATGRPRSKSDELKSVLSVISKQMHSPGTKERPSRGAARKQQDTQPSPAAPRAAGARARTSSGSSSSGGGGGGGSPTTRALKRRRQQPRVLAAAKSAAALSAVDGLVDLDGLLNMLTTPQRELFEQQCDEDLPQVLRDFHEALSQLDVYNVFASPVTEEEAPGYGSIITNPMDFGTMAEKIDDEYQDFAEYFVRHRCVCGERWCCGSRR